MIVIIIAPFEGSKAQEKTKQKRKNLFSSWKVWSKLTFRHWNIQLDLVYKPLILWNPFRHFSFIETILSDERFHFLIILLAFPLDSWKRVRMALLVSYYHLHWYCTAVCTSFVPWKPKISYSYKARRSDCYQK